MPLTSQPQKPIPTTACNAYLTCCNNQIQIFLKMFWLYIYKLTTSVCKRPIYILLAVVLILFIQFLNFYNLYGTGNLENSNYQSHQTSIFQFPSIFSPSKNKNNKNKLSRFSRSSPISQNFLKVENYQLDDKLKFLPMRSLDSKNDHKKGHQNKNDKINNKVDLNFIPEFDENGNIIQALSFKSDQFYLKNRKTKISEKFRFMSGSIHYFRLPKEYWRDRLLKLKATGANTVETYMPWNLHEHKPDLWNFSDNLDIYSFINLAGSLDLDVILRPGPYICAEWDFGGLPAWLLNDPNMQVRTNYPSYLRAVRNYFSKIFAILKSLFRSTNNGPIIAVAIENEYGAYIKRGHGQDLVHVLEIQKILLECGVPELLFTADGAYDLASGSVPDTLATVNFGQIGSDYEKFQKLKTFQPDKPIAVMEYWTGWFDHWSREHHHRDLSDFSENLNMILNFTENTNLNMYMFFGGTNFGFMNGANSERENVEMNTFEYFGDTTSYDYDAPLSEAGHMTDKFLKAREAISKALNIEPPSLSGLKNATSVKYVDASPKGYISIWDMIGYLDPQDVAEVYEPIAAEYLPIHGGTGQAHGYTLYTSKVELKSENTNSNVLSLEGFKNNIRDRCQIFFSKKRVGFIDANTYRDSIAGRIAEYEKVDVQILTENAGRVNYGYYLYNQRKGLLGRITSRGEPITNWKVFPLEFDYRFLEKLNFKNAFRAIPKNRQEELPTGLWKFELDLSENAIGNKNLEDTYIDMSDFNKGLVFVNKINLGRYWKRGPQLSLFWPKPYQIRGVNEILIFEELAISLSERKIKFSDEILISFRQDVLFEHAYSEEENEIDVL